MRVLSLFDGISCGMLALERIGAKVDEYVAYEIDKHAIQVSQKNYPNIIRKGDVFDGDFAEYEGFDLLIGGSPCTYWSIAKADREVTPDGIGGQLFMQFVRALKESKPKYFLYENNYSIHNDIKDFISRQLGVEPIMLNSALVSAQHRLRYYWTNIPNITYPVDKGILVKDILEDDDGKVYPVNTQYSKARTIKAQYGKNSIANFTRQDGSLGATAVATPIKLGHVSVTDGQANRVYSVMGKTCTMLSRTGGGGGKTGLYKIDLPDGDYIIRKLTPVEAERCQTIPDNYTEGISNTQRYKCVGNGWTVDIISHILSFIPDVTDM